MTTNVKAGLGAWPPSGPLLLRTGRSASEEQFKLPDVKNNI